MPAAGPAAFGWHGVGVEALVGDGAAAADRTLVGAVVQPLQGPVDRRQPVAQVFGDRVGQALGGQRLRRIRDVRRLFVFGGPVLTALRFGVPEQGLHLGALGPQPSPRLFLIHQSSHFIGPATSGSVMTAPFAGGARPAAAG